MKTIILNQSESLKNFSAAVLLREQRLGAPDENLNSRNNSDDDLTGDEDWMEATIKNQSEALKNFSSAELLREQRQLEQLASYAPASSEAGLPVADLRRLVMNMSKSDRNRSAAAMTNAEASKTDADARLVWANILQREFSLLCSIYLRQLPCSAHFFTFTLFISQQRPKTTATTTTTILCSTKLRALLRSNISFSGTSVGLQHCSLHCITQNKIIHSIFYQFSWTALFRLDCSDVRFSIDTEQSFHLCRFLRPE